MPTYEYKCLKCDYRFESFQKITDEPVRECPNCKGEVKRLISGGTGPIFKGTGFYQTDYKNAGKKVSTAEPVKPKTEPKKPEPPAKKD
jgi:putative FmdB family regulatory protein